MKEQEKQQYLEDYKKKKEKGVPFFPDILFKDALVGLILLLVLIALAYFLGAPLEERANPSDTTYLPRPEWYFRFLFQLLKYFPGNLEVLGVVVIPGIVVLLLFALPFLDRTAKRYFLNRIPVMGTAALLLVGVVGLTVASYLEAPPPTEIEQGDPTAALYTYNCAGCHGPASNITARDNLFDVISQGSHEDMPPWSGDLTNEEIDSLVGFIASPTGSEVFETNCGDCHDATTLMFGDPALLRQVLDLSVGQEEHSGEDVPFANQPLSIEQRTSLINFLIAPDGERLFVSYCSSCHGKSVSIEGDLEAFRQIITEGGMHRDMPAWGERFSDDEIEDLAQYVVRPSSSSPGADLYQTYCTACHFDSVPNAASVEEAFETIQLGNVHETMPVWGEILGEAQIDALSQYAFASSTQALATRGQDLYLDNCVSCHGEFGEGGANPSRPGDIIAPISTSEYLATRDDATITEIISRGQPDFGMAPFGLDYGGPFDDTDVDSLVEFIRSWEADPPVVLPPEVVVSNVNLSASEIYQSVCAQCHGSGATGGVGPSLRSTGFRANNTSQTIFTTIGEGHQATAMIAWGDILNSEQIQDLVDFILSLPITDESSTGEVSFNAIVKPVFEAYCTACHDFSFSEGGWNATSYDKILNSGDNAPVIVPGSIDESRLAQMILGNLGDFYLMPPSGNIPDSALQAILDWIEQGAQDN